MSGQLQELLLGRHGRNRNRQYGQLFLLLEQDVLRVEVDGNDEAGDVITGSGPVAGSVQHLPVLAFELTARVQHELLRRVDISAKEMNATSRF